jgi:Photosynthetic reaction centre cytochrome C subunit
MQINRNFIVVTVFVVAVIISVAAIEPTRHKGEFTNLQVLPKNISPKALQHIMVDEFQDALGVGCNFCHAQEKGSLHLDYASDEKPEKEIARAMMRMAMDINKKYFEVQNPLIGDSLMTVSCNTCHHGVAHPDPNE